MNYNNLSRRDIICAFVVGAVVGLLIQPILNNNLSSNTLSYITPLVRIGIFVFFCLIAPLLLWIAKLISRSVSSLRGLYQFAQFAAVGTMNSFIDVGIFNLETAAYGLSGLSNTMFAIFKAISFLFATTNSFFWNKLWTFDAQEKTNARQVSGFYGVALVGWGLNVVAATVTKAFGPADSHLWINIVAPLVGIAVSFAWNFLGYKFWVFKKK